jgi:hypothetical protein
MRVPQSPSESREVESRRSLSHATIRDHKGKKKRNLGQSLSTGAGHRRSGSRTKGAVSVGGRGAKLYYSESESALGGW